ncbi:IPT/TIG domain-containing protein [Dactylosporangium sucinum]|uniref:IPT/TIG domain-containing protein n=1 Tax=Dactylosporangium sucinum TaxID=1424081 RepID=A0A917TAW6_9ACTN|nr:IPT/TIG domain-containing protein [Dactylosporangium sucinum]GGM16822.1 hypothetical protein GCM10007977_017600 [Dactylosporangium sucinum]
MQVSKRLPDGRPAARAAVVLGLVAAGLVATATPSFAAFDPITTVTPAHGPSGGGNSISLTPTTAATFTGASNTVTVQFSFVACAATLPGQTPITSSAGAVTAGVVQAATGSVSGNNWTVTVPSTLILPPDVTAATSFYVCVYDGDTLGDAGIAETATAAYKVSPSIMPNPASGASGGGYSIDVTTSNPIFTPFSPSTYTVQFQAKTTTAPVCAATPQSASAPTASSASTMTGGVVNVPAANLQVPTSRSLKILVPTTMIQPYLTVLPTVTSSDFNICVYASSALVAETAPSVPFNLSGNVALSAQSGSTAGGNALTLTAAGPIFTTGNTYYVQLQSSTSHPNCDATYATTGSPVNPAQGTTRLISTSKLAVTLPAPVTAGSYNVCVYDSNTATTGQHLVAQAFNYYSAGAIPTIVSVSPATGPAQGGSTISVTGTNLPTAAGAMTASVGGTPMTILTQSATNFTAVTPPHAPGANFSISITLTNGPTYEGKNLFTFTNGITISPATAPNSKLTATDIDIAGVGFSDMTFAAAGVVDPNSSKSHVYLVKGAYDPKAGNPATTKTNGQVAECVDVLVISDTNLICSLYTAGNGPMATNAGRVMTGCTAVTTTATTVAVGAGCSFNPSDVGLTITGAGIPAATTVSAVSATGAATINKAITANITAVTPLVLSAATTKVIPDAVSTFSVNAKKITTTAATFAATDLGKPIYGPNIPAGSVITEVTDSKNILISGTMIANVAASATAPVFMVPGGPVPNGTYTLTVVSNGIINAATVTPAVTPPYVQSIISSGSTFTVADYN